MNALGLTLSLARKAQSHPNETAFVFDGDGWTYKRVHSGGNSPFNGAAGEWSQGR
jgi:hypothetical protein